MQATTHEAALLAAPALLPAVAIRASGARLREREVERAPAGPQDDGGAGGTGGRLTRRDENGG